MTRTTRMIYVEEISDKEESRRPSFEKPQRPNFTSPTVSHIFSQGEPSPTKSKPETQVNPSPEPTTDVTATKPESPQAETVIENKEETLPNMVDLPNMTALPKKVEVTDEILQDAEFLPRSDALKMIPAVKAFTSTNKTALPKKVEVTDEILQDAEFLPRSDALKMIPAVKAFTSIQPKHKMMGTQIRGKTSRKALHAVSDDMKTIEDSLLYEHLKPMFLCMKVFGLFFIKRKSQFGQSLSAYVKLYGSWQFYSIVLQLVLLANFFRSLLAFSSSDAFGGVLFFKVLTSIFWYESVSRAYLGYLSCSRKKRSLQDLFLSMEKICYSDGILPYEHPLRRTMHAFLLLTLLTAVANVAASAYGMFGPSQRLFNAYLAPVPADLPAVDVFKAFILFLIFINGTVAILSLSQFTVICYVLYKEFEYLCRTFVMKIRDDGQFTDDMEKFRIQHQKRCKLVEDADQMFKYYIANTYSTNVPLLCLLLYTIVYAENNDNSYRFIATFRLTYVLLQMIVVSVAATIINTQAHAPLADIYSIRVQDTTQERQLELSMFLNKLTGTQIGLTAWDMFVINKPTVLTVIGMILTYFFLLVQFKNPLQGATVCNCNLTIVNSTYALMQTM